MSEFNLFRNSPNAETFAAGQTIFAEGDPVSVMYVIVDGEIDVFYGDKQIDKLGPGDIFGEMALIDSSPRSATVVARTECRLVLIDEKRFTFMIQQTPYFALHLMRVLVGRLRRADYKPLVS